MQEYIVAKMPNGRYVIVVRNARGEWHVRDASYDSPEAAQPDIDRSKREEQRLWDKGEHPGQR